MLDPKSYSKAKLKIDFLEAIKLEKIDEFRPWKDLIILYFITYLVISFSILLSYEVSFLVYPFAAFLIAGRQGAFLQLVHEASHNRISKNKKINNFFGSWLTSYLVGINLKGYTSGHLSHHANTSTELEPKSDSEKYRLVDFSNPKIYLLFLKDILGLTALQIFFDYGNNNLEKREKKNNLREKITFFISLIFIQLVILSIFKFNLFNYFLFWLYPAMGPHMFLMRIRGIAEHGLSKQLGKKVLSAQEGQYYTRSFLTSKNYYQNPFYIILEKAMIGSFSVYYHHEHHMNTRIPYYNLKKFHELIFKEVNKNTENFNNFPLYEKGYFSAAFKTQLVPSEFTR